ncbi:MAG: MFS transporter [Pseudoclavibacter sp.]
MTRQRAPAQRPAPASGRRLGVVSTVMACTSGLTVANIYYAQPLLGSIAGAFGLSEGTAALAVTFTQIGYALGMVLLLPLGDRLENRSLIMWTTFGTAAALVIAGLAPTAGIFMAVSVLIGLCSVVAQIVVPFATHLAPPQALGRMLGTIMFGLLSGIMLARSVSSFAAAALGWRAIFLISAGLMVVLAIIVRLVLPRRGSARPPGDAGLLRSGGPGWY